MPVLVAHTMYVRPYLHLVVLVGAEGVQVEHQSNVDVQGVGYFGSEPRQEGVLRRHGEARVVVKRAQPHAHLPRQRQVLRYLKRKKCHQFVFFVSGVLDGEAVFVIRKVLLVLVVVVVVVLLVMLCVNKSMYECLCSISENYILVFRGTFSLTLHYI